MNVKLGGYDGAVLRRAHVITLILATLMSSTSGHYIILNPYRGPVIFRNGTTDVYTTESTVTHFAILSELEVPSYARQRRRSIEDIKRRVFSRTAARHARICSISKNIGLRVKNSATRSRVSLARPSSSPAATNRRVRPCSHAHVHPRIRARTYECTNARICRQ